MGIVCKLEGACECKIRMATLKGSDLGSAYGSWLKIGHMGQPNPTPLINAVYTYLPMHDPLKKSQLSRAGLTYGGVL